MVVAVNTDKPRQHRQNLWRCLSCFRLALFFMHPELIPIRGGAMCLVVKCKHDIPVVSLFLRISPTHHLTSQHTLL